MPTKLEAAKEILGEIFGINSPEVEEMIADRLEMHPLYYQTFCVHAEYNIHAKNEG